MSIHTYTHKHTDARTHACKQAYTDAHAHKHTDARTCARKQAQGQTLHRCVHTYLDPRDGIVIVGGLEDKGTVSGGAGHQLKAVLAVKLVRLGCGDCIKCQVEFALGDVLATPSTRTGMSQSALQAESRVQGAVG